MIDSSICVCVITAGLIGREEHWDIVITDTPRQPLTHADGKRASPLYCGRDGLMGKRSGWMKRESERDGCKDGKMLSVGLTLCGSCRVYSVFERKQFACFCFGCCF